MAVIAGGSDPMGEADAGGAGGVGGVGVMGEKKKWICVTVGGNNRENGTQNTAHRAPLHGIPKGSPLWQDANVPGGVAAGEGFK